MIVLVRKNNLALTALALVLTVMTAGMVRNADLAPVSAVPAANKVIVVDAGHGAPDGGAVGGAGTVEADINLAIAKRLQELLQKSGAQVVMTRSDGNAIADDMAAKIRDIKRSDLKNRRALRDGQGVDAFISIHLNKFEQSKYRGAQVFYAGGEEGKRLGETLQAELIALVDPSNTRVAKPADPSIYILKESKIPAVIVECGFLSNPDEERLLADPAYQEKVAWGIYTGITKYFE